MIKRKAIFLAPLAAAAIALPGIWAASASATGTAHGGLVHLYQVDTTISSQGGSPGQLASDSLILTGALHDYGVDSEAPPDSNINTFSFPPTNPTRSFQLDLTNFGTVQSQTVYPNCSFTQVVTGNDLQIVPGSGTGIYTGISGQFDVTATFAGVLPSLGQGCDVSQIGDTPTGLDFVEGTGIVHIPR
jgi:hypothetical protein